MNRRFILLLLLSCFFIQWSCTKNEYREPVELFEVEENVSGERIDIEGLQFSIPLNMLLLDSLLIIHDRYEVEEDKFFFSINNLTTNENIRIFGREGRGPDEFSFPAMLSRIPNKRESIGINNRSFFSFSEVSIPKVLADTSGYTISKTNEINTGYSKVAKISDDRFIGTGFFNDGRFGLADGNGKLLSAQLKYPFQDLFENIKNQSLGMAFQSHFSVHPSGKMFVAATTGSPNIDVLSLMDDSLYVIKSIHSSPPLFEDESTANIFSVKMLPENKGGYKYLASTEQFFYALYSGAKYEEGADKYNSGNRVLQFDWDGNPIKQYNLDKLATLIVVDEEDRYLYSIAKDSLGAYSLYKYEL
ncbi:MAG: hypothetical protein FH748_02595 [Balneolaceae bacterium]|nr:hypothetical protein [Balneolaceae bacterium]